MIKSFKCKETQRIFHGCFSKRLPQGIQRAAAMKLAMLHAAGQLETLRIPPSNRLECLASNREGQHSIRINKQWRIYFVWNNGHVWDVEIVDYH